MPHSLHIYGMFHERDQILNDTNAIPDWPPATKSSFTATPKTAISINNAELEAAPRTGSFSSVKEDTEDISQSFLNREASSRGLVSHLTQYEDWAKCLPACGVPFADSEAAESDRSSISEASTLDDETTPVDHAISYDTQPDNYSLNLQNLPLEVLENIIDCLAVDLPPQDYGPRNSDLLACLLTSKSLYKATMNILYKHISIPHSYVFSKFLTHIKKYPELGRLVRRMDLSHFSSIGLGRTLEMNKEIQNMTATTLLECLDLMPQLQELLLQEHLDHDINEDVLFKIFNGLPRLRALDLCGAYANGFEAAFTEAITRATQQTDKFRIKRLSLHECFTIKNSDIHAIVSRLPKLQILDVYHTRITASTLQSIPHTARLTHLNLGHCTNLTGAEVVDFLSNHPAASELVYLNLSCDPARHRMLRANDLDNLLPTLPTTLRSLNLGGAQLEPSMHMPHLLRLSKHLEELGLAHTTLSITDIKSFFPQPAPSSPSSSPISSSSNSSADEGEPFTATTLHYLNLSDITSVTQPALFHHRSGNGSSSRVDADHPAPIPHLLSAATLPLEVLEINKRTTTDLQRMTQSNLRYGWVAKEFGRRSWYVREVDVATAAATAATATTSSSSSAQRWWKMGCRSWGMKKCPVVVGEVGGIYGFHMFKK